MRISGEIRDLKQQVAELNNLKLEMPRGARSVNSRINSSRGVNSGHETPGPSGGFITGRPGSRRLTTVRLVVETMTAVTRYRGRASDKTPGTRPGSFMDQN